MAKNPALVELEKKANFDEAKRDLMLRFVRDQESLQTSQVDLKLVDDSTIDLIDSATNEESINDGVTGIRREEGQPLAPRPPSGRPHSRLMRKTSYEPPSIHKLKLSRAHSSGEKLTSNMDKLNRTLSPSKMDGMNRTMPTNMDRYTRPMSPPPVDNAQLNSSWPEREFISRKLSTSRKYVLCSPERLGQNDSRPTSGIRPITSEHLKNADGSPSRSTSPSKRQGSKSLGRTFMNLNLEPVHPSEIPLLRGRSASSTVSGPYTLVHLPPIQTTPPSGI